MPTLELNLLMVDAAAKVLEAMCFTSISGEALELPYEENSWVAAKLDFTGQCFSGNFGIGVSQLSACSIAANFLGLNAEELSPLQIHEVVGELTNMIAGSLLGNFKTDSFCVLSHPEMGSSEELIRRLQNSSSRIFQLEDGFFAVWLQIHE